MSERALFAQPMNFSSFLHLVTHLFD